MNGGFVEFEGQVHLLSPIGGGEHTLCGVAFDAGSHEAGLDHQPTPSKVVTCPTCTTVIHHCRGVRTGASK